MTHTNLALPDNEYDLTPKQERREEKHSQAEAPRPLTLAHSLVNKTLL